MTNDELTRERKSGNPNAGKVLDTCRYRDFIICACEDGVFMRMVARSREGEDVVMWSSKIRPDDVF